MNFFRRFRQWLSKSREHSGALVRKADQAKRAGAWREAADLYRQALELTPERAGTWVQYGHALREGGEPGAAVQAYVEAIARRPNIGETHLYLGRALLLTGALGDAELALKAALEIDPALGPAAVDAVRALRRQKGLLDETIVATINREVLGASYCDGPVVVLDVTDLIDYSLKAQRPSGIQRVQLEILRGLLLAGEEGSGIVAAAYSDDRGVWIEVPQKRLMALLYSMLHAATNDWRWRSDAQSVADIIDLGPPRQFVDGDVIVNLGSSWSANTYFSGLENLKASCRVGYIPFVHDLIPLVHPQFCLEGLPDQFAEWLKGVFIHADGVLTNSESTKRDLLRVAAELCVVISDDAVEVTPLDGCLGQLEGATGDELLGGPYILLVSTLEPRKNHQTAFEAWLLLAARRQQQMPRLVCVGQFGWMYDEMVRMLESHPSLKENVLLLGGVSEAQLASLYRGCLFTLYPSFYEGWGLPVTESLCFRKVPLVSETASLPEAGGVFASYFDPHNPAQLADRVEALLDDNYRLTLEGRIAAEWRPRSWSAIGDQVVSFARRRCAF
ncbi:glycosyl transferase, group 1 family protein [Brevundimonas sp. BAL3]|uniref:glycosyltransferase family 4 protein n=1 Tax=Brevundimonas sp. BAL3 TaxID=391600 RepID=UPI00017EC6F4|nr:glycosyltransferase family 1 protein [Brevundimonas sp. BAL3]EDX80715.1 glycosyl transferase, group 1 family protein [Brevundimonas sp. BAL3]